MVIRVGLVLWKWRWKWKYKPKFRASDLSCGLVLWGYQNDKASCLSLPIIWNGSRPSKNQTWSSLSQSGHVIDECMTSTCLDNLDSRLELQNGNSYMWIWSFCFNIQHIFSALRSIRNIKPNIQQPKKLRSFVFFIWPTSANKATKGLMVRRTVLDKRTHVQNSGHIQARSGPNQSRGWARSLPVIRLMEKEGLWVAHNVPAITDSLPKFSLSLTDKMNYSHIKPVKP